LLAPIALAVILSVLFRPAVRWMERIRLPTAVASAVVVLGIIAALVAAGFALAGPLRGWVIQAPQSLAAAEQRLARVRKPVQKIAEATNHLTQAGTGSSPSTGPTTAPTTTPSDGGGGAEPASAPQPAQSASVAVRFLGSTSRILGEIAEVLLLLYLILASSSAFREKLVRSLPGGDDKRIAREVVHQSESIVARYMIVTAMINLGQAVVVAVVMWWIGMPTPLLWGVFTFVLEFVPYLGGALLIILLTMTALAMFDSVGKILLPGAAYLLITTLQNNLVSPVAYGNRLKLNPVAVFIGVLFWWFVWGVLGAFLAVPILAIAKITTKRIERLRAIAEFLGD